MPQRVAIHLAARAFFPASLPSLLSFLRVARVEGLGCALRPLMHGNVLVVDNDVDAANMLTVCLRGQGYRVTSETNPTQALADAMDEQVEVVITDLQMRNLDGLALCERIVGARPDLPVAGRQLHLLIDDDYTSPSG